MKKVLITIALIVAPLVAKADSIVYTNVAGSSVTGTVPSATYAASAGTATALSTEYGFYDHAAHSVYSGTTSTGAAWTVCPSCEVSLYTTTIPGGTMGTHGYLYSDAAFSITSSSNTKTVRMYYNSTLINGQNITTSTGQTLIRKLENRSASSQVGSYPYAVSGAINFYSINSAVDQPFELRAITSLESGQTPTSSSSGDGATCTVTILPSHGYNSNEYIQAAGGSNCTTSGSPNGDPVLLTKLSATQFTYPCTCSGNMQATFPTIKRYSVIQLESVDGTVKYRP